MASNVKLGNQSRGEQETISEEEKVSDDYNQLILSLPRENGSINSNPINKLF